MDPRLAEEILADHERKRLQEDGYITKAMKDFCEREETKVQDSYLKYGTK